MIDSQGNPIVADSKKDDIFLGMEQNSGVNIQARQRVQINFFLQNDLLFGFLQSPYYITPLSFIRRESIMTKEQVREILGPLYAAKTARTAGIAVLIVIGGLLCLLAGFMLWRWRKVLKAEEGGMLDTSQEKTHQGKIQQETFLSGELSRGE